MTPLGHWTLAAICGILGLLDIIMFVKTPRDGRAVLHWAVLVCGGIALVLAVIQTVSLLTQSQPV